MDGKSLKSSADTYSSAIEHAVNYTRWVIGAVTPYIGRRLLEVGLGHGSYRKHLPALDLYIGMDIDQSAAVRMQAAYPGDRFFCADITDASLPGALVNDRIDTVLCINVIEHIDDDRYAVANMLQMLMPGGHLLLFVPAFKALYSNIDRMAGHYRRYVKQDIDRLIPPGKGGVILNDYFNPLGGMGWWLNKFLPHKSLNSTAVNQQIELFDRYVLPVSRLIDPLTRSFFGQSLLTVIRKP